MLLMAVMLAMKGESWGKIKIIYEYCLFILIIACVEM
jgi:hypothetical protein